MPRLVYLSLAESTLRCPAGHVIPGPHPWNDGVIRCRDRLMGAAGKRWTECGRLLYLVGGGLVTPSGRPLFLLAEVSPAEAQRMARERMTVEHAARFLGILL